MNDLFAFGSAVPDPSASDRYGLTGDLKKTQYLMQLLGHPSDPDTLKCLIIAAEKGIEVESGILNIPAKQHLSDDYLAIEPLGVAPALKEANYTLAGDLAIISFIEGRGLGNRMPPRNAAILAEQNFWVDVARTNVDPYVRQIVSEKLLKGICQGESIDEELIGEAKAALEPIFDVLDEQLTGKKFIVGDYSYADVHWTAYVHLLDLAGQGSLLDLRPGLKAWFERIKAHKSFSGQDIVAYDLLPTIDDIKRQSLSSVVITDF